MLGALEAMQNNLNNAFAAKKEVLLDDHAFPFNKKFSKNQNGTFSNSNTIKNTTSVWMSEPNSLASSPKHNKTAGAQDKEII